MTSPVRIALKIGSALSLVVAIFVVTIMLILLNRLEHHTVAGLIIIVPAWLAVASAVVALPLILVRADWAARLTWLSALGALPLGLAFCFSRVFCLFTGCTEWGTEHVVQASGLIVIGPLVVASLFQWLTLRK